MLMGTALKMLREFLDKKTATSLLVLLLVLGFIPVGLFLIKQAQIFQPKAAGELIQLGEGGCIRVNKDKQKAVDCSLVPLKITNPFFNINAVNPSVGGQSPSPTSAAGRRTVRVNGRTDVEIQAALDSIRDTGGAVYIPAGQYDVSKGLKVFSNTTVFGDGIDKTIINQKADFEQPFVSNDTNAGTENITIRELTLKGGYSDTEKINSDGAVDRCCAGIQFKNFKNGFVYKVKVEGFGQSGILLSFNKGKGANNVRISECQSLNNFGGGVEIWAGSGNVIDNCLIKGNNASRFMEKRNAAINIEVGVDIGASRNKIINNQVIDNHNAGIQVVAGGSNNTPAERDTFKVEENAVCNNTSQGNGDIGIGVGKSRNVVIANKITRNERGYDFSNTNGNPDREGQMFICTQREVDGGVCFEITVPPPVGPLENKNPNATHELCTIPDSYGIPQQPSKPQAYVTSPKNIWTGKLLTEVSAAENPGSDKLLYRLAESQAGLESAQWKEFAFLPAQTNLASKGVAQTLSELVSTLLDKINPFVYAVDSDDVFLNREASSPPPSSPGSSGTPTFNIGPQFINTSFQLSSEQIGAKQIWVQLLHPDGTTRVDNVNFNLVEKPPQILGLSCNLDISKENLKITIEGVRFGSGVGTVEAVSPQAKPEVLGWNNKQIIAFLKKPNIPINEGQRFKFKVTRLDGFESGVATCAVDKSLVSLGARIFCREAGKFDASDVIVNLLYNPSDPANPDKLNKVEEKVTINANGEIGNLKTKLQAGKNYAISIKAPSSLRRATTFTAQEGTTQISQLDGSPFILPIGDIAPPVSPDGRINTLDRAELIRQWRILGKESTKQTGDFNRDTRVNSIDWACMNYDFGKEDDPIPTSLPQSASGSIHIPGGEETIVIPSSASPAPTGSRGPEPSPSKDTSNSAKIDIGGKLFLDTNRNRIADIGESFISQGLAVVRLLQVPEDHVVGTTLTPEELEDSRILAQVTNNLPGANYDISVFVDKDSGTKFSLLATANSGQLEGTVDFALGPPLTNSSLVINLPVSSPTQ